MSKKLKAKITGKKETPQELKRRLARNKRVRDRRKKAREAKRAAKSGTAIQSGVGEIDITERDFAVIISKDSVTGYLDGSHVFALTSLVDNEITPVVDCVALISAGFGAKFHVTDLRKR